MEYSPTLQLAHTENPVPLVYVPAEQLPHWPPERYFPAWQTRGVVVGAAVVVLVVGATVVVVVVVVVVWQLYTVTPNKINSPAEQYCAVFKYTFNPVTLDMILKYVVVLVTTKLDVFLFVTPPMITAE